MPGTDELIGFALVLTAGVLIVVGSRARKRKRDAELARVWEWATSSPYGPDWHLVFVQRVYQRACLHLGRSTRVTVVPCTRP